MNENNKNHLRFCHLSETVVAAPLMSGFTKFIIIFFTPNDFFFRRRFFRGQLRSNCFPWCYYMLSFSSCWCSAYCDTLARTCSAIFGARRRRHFRSTLVITRSFLPACVFPKNKQRSPAETPHRRGPRDRRRQFLRRLLRSPCKSNNLIRFLTVCFVSPRVALVRDHLLERVNGNREIKTSSNSASVCIFADIQ